MSDIPKDANGNVLIVKAYEYRANYAGNHQLERGYKGLGHCVFPKGKNSCHDRELTVEKYVTVRTSLVSSDYSNKKVCIYRNNERVNCWLGETKELRVYDTSDKVDLWEVRTFWPNTNGYIATNLRVRYRGYPKTNAALNYEPCNILDGNSSCTTQLTWSKDNNFHQTCLFSDRVPTGDDIPLACWPKDTLSGQFEIEISHLPEKYVLVSADYINMYAYDDRKQYVYSEVISEVDASGLFQGISLASEPATCEAYLPTKECQSTVSWETTDLPEGCLFKADGTLLFCGQKGNVTLGFDRTTDVYLRATSDSAAQILGALRISYIPRSTGAIVLPTGNQCSLDVADQTSCELTLDLQFHGSHASLYNNGNLIYTAYNGNGETIGPFLLTVPSTGTFLELRDSDYENSNLLDAVQLRTDNHNSEGFGIIPDKNTCEIDSQIEDKCTITATFEVPGGETVYLFQIGSKRQPTEISLQTSPRGNLYLHEGKTTFQLRTTDKIESDNLVAQHVLFATRKPYADITTQAKRCTISRATQQKYGAQATCNIQVDWHWECSQIAGSNITCKDNKIACLFIDDINQGPAYCDSNLINGSNNFQFDKGSHIISIRELIDDVPGPALATKAIEAKFAFTAQHEITVPNTICTIYDGVSCSITANWRSNISACLTTSDTFPLSTSDPKNIACTANLSQLDDGFWGQTDVAIVIADRAELKLVTQNEFGEYDVILNSIALEANEFVVSTELVVPTSSCTINQGTSCEILASWRTNISACLTTSDTYPLSTSDPNNIACTANLSQLDDGFWGQTDVAIAITDRTELKLVTADKYGDLTIISHSSALVANNSEEVVWSTDNFSVGQPVQVSGLLPEVVQCISDDSQAIRITNYKPVVIYQPVSGNYNWLCYDSSDEVIQRFSASIIVHKLSAPQNLTKH